MAMWNLWHGCLKKSPGCRHCYVYRGDEKRGKDASKIYKTGNFYAPIKRNKNGEYKYPSGTMFYTCFTSDFFLEEASEWRKDAWEMIATRSDADFLFITKRIERFYECIPKDWGEGYSNVTICCTCENQDTADSRLPIYTRAPIKHKYIVCEPLLSKIDLSAYLSKGIKGVLAGGESGPGARVCDYEWILYLRDQCAQAGISFTFRQTGAVFRKNGKVYHIPRRLQFAQARKADINLL